MTQLLFNPDKPAVLEPPDLSALQRRREIAGKLSGGEHFGRGTISMLISEQ
jgi:hypothetical protein